MRNSLMRIAQLLLPGASSYERKSQRLDFEALNGQAAGQAESMSYVGQPLRLSGLLSGFDLAHVYGPRELPASLFIGFPIPYVASGVVRKPRFAFRSPVEPDYALAPVENDDFTLLPEAVDDSYFDVRQNAQGSPVIGSIDRPSVRNSVEQAMARIHRFRDDINWQLFTHQPTPAELAQLSAWIDPAVEADDFDGLTAEALVVGLPVVATRTPINMQRCEEGRTGVLVPARDPNELVHAILAALFKPEVANPKISAARQTASKFRIRQRLRVLGHIYENLTR
jgi:Glycosyl transferases group 1